MQSTIRQDVAAIPADARSGEPTRARLWGARILGFLVCSFLLVDAVGKAVGFQPHVDGTMELGFARHMVAPIGIILLLCTVTYLIPRTATLGAVLLTGYLGGAVAIQLQAGNPLLSHTLFPVYIGVMAWGALYLRDPRLSMQFPVREDG